MKQLTERQAWLYLARKWDRPRRDPEDGFPVVFIFNTLLLRNCACLCNSCFGLFKSGRVIEPIYSDMRNRLHKNKPNSRPGCVFWWPLTKAGARSRAAFCRRMAKEC